MQNLPTIIQNIVYRKKDDVFEVLVLKRTEDRGGFWNVVNGTLGNDESINDCRKRELFEEAGIKDVLDWGREIYRFNFGYKGKMMTVAVFGVQVSEDQNITINDEHTEYRWASFDEAIEMMKFDDDKQALEKCREMLMNT